MIILRLLLLLTNLHLKLLSTQGTGADKLLSTQRVNFVIFIILNNILNSGQGSSRLYLYNTFHKFKINIQERCKN